MQDIGVVHLTVAVPFSHSNKQRQKLADVANIMETRGNRLLCNVKASWMFVLAHAKRVLAKYHAMVLKMHQDDKQENYFAL
jgi:hypothetical protein